MNSNENFNLKINIFKLMNELSWEMSVSTQCTSGIIDSDYYSGINKGLYISTGGHMDSNVGNQSNKALGFNEDHLPDKWWMVNIIHTFKENYAFFKLNTTECISCILIRANLNIYVSIRV